MPKTRQASFGNVCEQNLENLAHVPRIILLKLYLRLDDPDFVSGVDTEDAAVVLHAGYRSLLHHEPGTNPRGS
jgi:hypothetical protein